MLEFSFRPSIISCLNLADTVLSTAYDSGKLLLRKAKSLTCLSHCAHSIVFSSYDMLFSLNSGHAAFIAFTNSPRWLHVQFSQLTSHVSLASAASSFVLWYPKWILLSFTHPLVLHFLTCLFQITLGKPDVFLRLIFIFCILHAWETCLRLHHLLSSRIPFI